MLKTAQYVPFATANPQDENSHHVHGSLDSPPPQQSWNSTVCLLQQKPKQANSLTATATVQEFINPYDTDDEQMAISTLETRHVSITSETLCLDDASLAHPLFESGANLAGAMATSSNPDSKLNLCREAQVCYGKTKSRRRSTTRRKKQRLERVRKWYTIKNRVEEASGVEGYISSI